LLGTPYYLAPELYGGADAGPRSDQFSFCVALFAALHGERPFEGPTLDALRANVQAGRITEPRMAPRLPRRIRAALQRGLSADPTARFASLDDLLVELAPPRRRVARWTLGLVGTAMAGAALLAWVRSDPEDQRCTGAATLFASAWNPERRATVASAFTAVHAPYADDALVRVQAGLDRYAAQWISAHTDTCRATRIRGEQTEATLDLRMTCLERRRQAAAALAGTLATGDAATVRSAVAAVLALPDLSACGDLAALRQVVSPPSDPIVRRQIAALNAHLAEARASFDTGAFARARELIGPIATEAHALGYQPFEAEVRLVQGQIQRDLGDLPGAEASVQAAIWSAEAGRHDEIAATAWARLVFLIGYDRAEFARAESFVPRATAALARLGDNPAIEAELERSIGALAFRKGDTDAALAHADKAVVLAERAHGPEHLDVARMINGLAVIVLTRGDTARAIPLLEHTVQIFEKLLGPNHTSVARALLNLGSARVLGWDAAAAEPELRRGVAIWQAALGADNRDVADALASLSQGLREQGKLDEALQVARRAVAIAERVMGVDDSMLVGLLFELGLVELRLARFSDAESHLRRASAIASKVFAPDDSRQMNVIAALADSRALQSRWREAAALYEQAIPALQRRPGLHKQLGITETSYARVLIELHQPSRAIASLERLARTREQQRPQLRPMIDLTLARALWESGGDRQRACQLASDAHASAMQTTGMSPRDLEQIENWLASHHRC
jgi:tetratricopeptide (TPR) repeat protein